MEINLTSSVRLNDKKTDRKTSQFHRWCTFICFIFVSLSIYAQQITGSTSLCSGQTATYIINGGSGTYNWTVSGGTITTPASGETQISVLWNNTGTGSVTATSGSSTANLSVSVVASPNPKIFETKTVSCNQLGQGDRFEEVLLGQEPTCYNACENTTFTYYTTLNAGSTYVWNVTGQQSYTVSNNQITVIWGAVGSGTISVTETNANNCATTASKCIEILKAPSALFTALPLPVSNVINVCRNQEVNFIDQSIDAVNWSWDFGDGSQSSTQSPSHSYGQAGTYTVTLTVGNGIIPTKGGYLTESETTKEGFILFVSSISCNCTSTYTMTVVVAADNGPKIECISTICGNETATYSTPADCSNYTWSVSGGTITSTNGSEVTVDWGTSTSGAGYLTLDVGNCSGYCPVPTTVVVPIVPTTTTITGAQVVCYGTTHGYTMPQIPGTTYTWSAQGGYVTSGQGTNHVQMIWAPDEYEAGYHFINVTYTHNVLGCSGTAQLEVYVAPELEIYYTNFVQVCEGEVYTNEDRPITLSNLFTDAPVVGNWTVITPNGNILTNVQTNSATFTTYNYNDGPGTYTLIATPTSGVYCNEQATATVQVNAKPAAPSSISGQLVICGGTSSTYTANSNESGFYTWTVVGGTVTAQQDNSVTVTWDAVGPYSLTAVLSNAFGCVSNPFTVELQQIQPTVAPAISGLTAICLGGLATYSFDGDALPGITYEWSITPPELGNILTDIHADNAQISWSDNNQVSATATVTLTVTSPCGQTTTTSMEVNLTGFTPDFILPTICEDVEFTVSYNDPASYLEWSFGDLTTGSNLATVDHTYTNSGTFPISLFVQDANGCSALVSKVVNVNPSPIANITTADRREYCPGEIISVDLEALNGTGTTPYTYAWYMVGNPVSFASGSTTNVTQTGSYYAVFTNEFGCSTESEKINIYYVGCGPCPMEAHTADFSHAINAGTCNSVSFTPNNSANIRPVSWFYLSDAGGYVFMSNDASPTYAFDEAGYYWVRMIYRGPNINGVAGDSVDCFVDRQIFLPIVASFTSTFSCDGNNVVTQFDDQSGYFNSGEIDSYTWTLDGAAVPFSTAQNPALTLPGGTYLVSLEIASTAYNVVCSVTKEIIVPTSPTAAFTYSAVSCPGSSVYFTDASTGDSLNGWTWTFGNGIAGSNAQNPVRQFNDAGIYDVTLSIRNIYGCTTEVTHSFTIGTPENGTITVDGSTTFCAGGSVILTAPAGTDYLWSNGATTSSITVTTAGAYSVSLTGANGCNYSTAAITVNVITPANIQISGENNTCSGTRLDLTASAGFSMYSWSADIAPFDAVADQNFYVGSYSLNTYLNPGSYNFTVVGTDANGCVATSDPYLVVVNQTPNFPEIQQTNLALPCAGTPITLEVPLQEAGVTYHWSTGQTGGSIVVSQAGTYTVSADGGNGCTSDGFFGFTIFPAPDVSGVLSGCYSFCADEAPLVLQGVAGAQNTWYQQLGGQLHGNYQVGVGSTFSVSQSGTYYLVASNGFCTSQSETINVDFIPLPDVSITVDQTQVCEGSEAELTAHGADSYEWFIPSDTYTCDGNSILTSVANLTNALAQNDQLNSEYVNVGIGEIMLTGNPLYDAYLTDLEPKISIDNDIVWSISSGYTSAYWYIYSQSNYDSYVEMEINKNVPGVGTSFDFGTIASIQSIIPDVTQVNLDGTNNHIIINALLDNSTVVQIPGRIYTVISSGFFGRQEALSIAECTNLTPIGTGSSVTVNPVNGSTYTVIGTNSSGCTKEVSITLTVIPYVSSATIDCCADKSICKGTSASIPVTFTGSGPWTFTYSNGVSNTTVTTTSNPYNIVVSPLLTTTYSLVSVSGTDQGCTEVCGKATVAVTNCTAVVQPKKGPRVKDCSKNCFSSTVRSVVDSAPGCKTVTIRVSCDNTCQAALSHFSVSVQCGTITKMSNSLGFPMGSVSPDPTTGLFGFKVDNIQNFCEGRTLSTFDVTYTVCTTDSDCGNGSFCAPLVSYKSGTCVNYGITSNPSNLKDLTQDNSISQSGEVVLNVYPNPFNEAATIALDLPSDMQVEIAMFDLNGKKILDLHSGELSAGTSVFRWDGTNENGEQLPDGIYYVKSKINDEYRYVKVIYVK